MKKRVPASTTTRKRIEDLISGVEGNTEYSDLVRLATQLIIEEALEEMYAPGLSVRALTQGSLMANANDWHLRI